jgi:hypothetical protein
MPPRPRVPLYIGLIAFACVILYTLAVLGVLYAIGVLDRPLIGPEAARVPAPMVMPSEDVPGEDIEGLPRFPGSIRLEYTEERQGQWLVTEAEYVVDADPDDVRGYFRDAFRTNGWQIDSTAFTLGEWVYQVTNGDVSAVVEIEPREVLIEIEIEIQVAAP